MKKQVSILGKGEEEVTVDNAQTIGDLRNVLALDTDVQASNDEGDQLSEDTKVSDVQGRLNFVPNIEGGL